MIKGLLSLLGSGAQLPYFLDEYGGSFAAYSFKRLSSIDECITVIRDSDDAELIIEFDNSSANSGINESSLLSWLGGSIGYIKQFWDLTGNGNHLIQTDKAKMFKIAELGSVFNENGNLAARCDNASYNIIFPSEVLQPFTSLQIQKVDSGINSISILFSDVVNKYYAISYFRYASGGSQQDYATLVDVNAKIYKPIVFTQSMHINVIDGADSEIYFNNDTAVSFPFNVRPLDGILLGERNTGISPWIGTFQELILFQGNKSGDVEGMKTNRNDVYSIPNW